MPDIPSPEAIRYMPRDVDRVAIVIPCHRVARHILQVLSELPAWVWRIYVVDDKCPEQSGALVQASCADPRVVVLFNEENLGVGGAVMAGYEQAAAEGAEVIVKMDGDGQMDPALLPKLVGPILRGDADYTKGNRFYDLARIGSMPPIRIIGNAALSFLSKLSTGYWDIFDPTNGYTALHARLIADIPLERISKRYFFETDLLFRLNTLRAVVVDIPMHARYGSEVSGLRVGKALVDFSIKHARNTFKRIFYNYFLRDVSLATVQLLAGTMLMAGGLVAGIVFWAQASGMGQPTSPGRVMLAALPVILGLQFFLGFVAYDMASVPRRPIHRLLR